LRGGTDDLHWFRPEKRRVTYSSLTKIAIRVLKKNGIAASVVCKRAGVEGTDALLQLIVTDNEKYSPL
jgi:hypothetical protein